MKRVVKWITGILIISGLLSCGNQSGEKVYTSVAEGKTVEVPALTGGKIISLSVRQGQMVQQNDLLAVIDTTDLVYQLQQLQASLSELEVQQQLAQTSLQQAQTNLHYLKEKRDRIQALFEKQSASRQAVDDINNRYQQAQTALQSARQQFKSIEARRARLMAQIKTVQKKIHDAVIRAPLSGVVAETYFEEGEAVPPLNPIVEILHTSEVDIKIYVSEKTLPHIKYGQQVKVQVDGSDQTFTGVITWISNKAEFTPKTILTPETRTSLVYAVNVNVKNEKGILKHGMPVEVRL